MRFGPAILAQAGILGTISEEPDRLTRKFLTPEHRLAGEHILRWMREAGMEAQLDTLGNAVGRYAADDPNARTILMGSHLDSVVDAGKYDGVFGILCAIACVRELHRRGQRLSHALEVVAFGDEEGVRFGASMTGSKAFAGRFDDGVLERRDAQGVTLEQALRDWGGDPNGIASLARDPAGLAAYVEVHIEQGPVLLDAGLPLGVVTSIAGSTRVLVRVEGLAGHAGTVPMVARRDALAAACEMVLAVESHCREHSERLVGTVGRLAVTGGGATNVIPGTVEFSVDLRSGEDSARHTALAAVEGACRGIAARRKVDLHWDPYFHLGAAACTPALQKQLADAIRAHALPVLHLPSGAGHDAMQFALRVPTAMLFVRCGNGGISHNPLETLSAEDADAATSVLLRFLEEFPGKAHQETAA